MTTPAPPELRKMAATPAPPTQESAINSNIMDILKKAAQEMINISAKKDGEKKTRFAHTRKVAARKAEKLKMKLGGAELKPAVQSKPKSVCLNIAHLKPGFSFRPVSSVPSSLPSPQSEERSECSSRSPSVQSEDIPTRAATPLFELPPSVPQSRFAFFNPADDMLEEDSPMLKKYMQEMSLEGKAKEPPKDKPYLLYEINSEDGLHVQSTSLTDAWMKVYDELQDARIAARMKKATLSLEDLNGYRLLGLENPALVYLLEQLPGAEFCPDYEFRFHPPAKEAVEIPENKTGCARSEGFYTRREYDMFNFLASEYRNRPVFLPPEEGEEESSSVAQKSSRRAATSLDMPIAMRFKFLKTAARETVGVFRSSIHGRGLFCKRTIDPGELVIEYAGEVIRSVLTDKRERIYQSKGIGCYMFRIDDDEVVDATMHGNAARFINHSCEPNCFSKVITVDGKKHIVIFALRRIMKGEELTYDYKFPFEEEKIPCSCNSKRCRKYLN